MEETAFPTGSFSAGESAGDGRAVSWLTSLTSALFSCADWRAAWADHVERQVNQGQTVYRETGILETPVPAYWLSLLQTWRSFSWDPVGFPSLSGPQLCTGAEKWDKENPQKRHIEAAAAILRKTGCEKNIRSLRARFEPTCIYGYRLQFLQKIRCQSSRH